MVPAETTRRSPFREGALPVFDVQTATEAKDPATAIGTLGLVDGRFVNVDFDNSKGGSWDYQKFPEHAPFEEEKVLALKELVDSRPTLGNVSRDNALDGRDPYISFRSDTPQAIDRLLGGILSEDWETVAPSMSADGKSPVGFDLRSKDAGSLRRAAGTKGILFPNLGYGNQLGSSMYALIFSRFSTDMNLANKLRVRREGDNGPPIPADRKVAFTDPVTGTRYIALRFGNETIQGRAVETGIASRMIQHVNDLGKAAYVLADNTVSANGEYNYATTGTQPRVADPAAEKALRRYIGLLDAMRQIGNMYGGGPIGNGGGD